MWREGEEGGGATIAGGSVNSNDDKGKTPKHTEKNSHRHKMKKALTDSEVTQWTRLMFRFHLRWMTRRFPPQPLFFSGPLPQSLCLVTVARLPNVGRLVHFYILVHNISHSWPSMSLENSLAKKKTCQSSSNSGANELSPTSLALMKVR